MNSISKHSPVRWYQVSPWYWERTDFSARVEFEPKDSRNLQGPWLYHAHGRDGDGKRKDLGVFEHLHEAKAAADANALANTARATP